MKATLLVEGDRLQSFKKAVAARGSLFSFSRIRPVPPASSLNKKKRRSFLRKNSLEAWQQRLQAGEEPGTLQEWKSIYWGASSGDVLCEEEPGRLVFIWREIDGSPAPIVEHLSENYPELDFLLLLSEKTTLYQKGSRTVLIDSGTSLQQIRQVARKYHLEQFLEYNLRLSARLIRGTREDIDQGARVLVETSTNEKLSLQKYNPLSRADLLLEDWERADDVLLPSYRGFSFWLDLYD